MEAEWKTTHFLYTSSWIKILWNQLSTFSLQAVISETSIYKSATIINHLLPHVPKHHLTKLNEIRKHLRYEILTDISEPDSLINFLNRRPNPNNDKKWPKDIQNPHLMTTWRRFMTLYSQHLTPIVTPTPAPTPTPTSI